MKIYSKTRMKILLILFSIIALGIIVYLLVSRKSGSENYNNIAKCTDKVSNKTSCKQFVKNGLVCYDQGNDECNPVPTSTCADNNNMFVCSVGGPSPPPSPQPQPSACSKSTDCKTYQTCKNSICYINDGFDACHTSPYPCKNDFTNNNSENCYSGNAYHITDSNKQTKYYCGTQQPPHPSGGCKDNSDCKTGQTCVNGSCVDSKCCLQDGQNSCKTGQISCDLPYKCESADVVQRNNENCCSGISYFNKSTNTYTCGCDSDTSCPVTQACETNISTCVTPTYKFNYNTNDNHLNINVKKDMDNYFFVLGDWGAGEETGCALAQIAVANKMIDYYNKHKSTKNLLFILTLGDNFYWTGLNNDTNPITNMFNTRWANTYGPLCNYKWLAGMGNHDWGDNDPYCVCPSDNPYTTIGDQPYQCNQLNKTNDDYNKGGNRPEVSNNDYPNITTNNYYMPDFGYHYTINDLDLEIIVTSQSGDNEFGEVGGSGGTGDKQMIKNCGGADKAQAKLTDIANAGRVLIKQRSLLSKNKNIIVTQHYDNLEHTMYDNFVYNNKTKNLQLISASGHIHQTYCDQYSKTDSTFCTGIVAGGGGGCCASDEGHKPSYACDKDGKAGPGAGFFVVTIDTNKVMRTKQIMMNTPI